MTRKLINYLKSKKAYISIETILVTGLMIGLLVFSIGSFKTTNGHISTSEQVVYNTDPIKKSPSVSNENNKTVIKETIPKLKEETFSQAGNVKTETNSVIYDVFINIIGSIIGTIVLGLITLLLKNYKSKDKTKKKIT